MAKIISKINVRSPEFIENAAHMQVQVDDLKAKLEQIKLGGGERSRERHLSRGKLLPRDRVNALLDVGSPFLELSQLAPAAIRFYIRRQRELVGCMFG